MQQEKFTPGPWFVSLSPAAISEINKIPGSKIFYKHVKDKGNIGGKIICKCLHSNLDILDSNAKLIAAAPDMYAVIKELYDWSIRNNTRGPIFPKLADIIKKVNE